MPHVCMRSPPMHHVPSCKSDTALVPHIYLLFVCVHLCRVSGGVAASGLGALAVRRVGQSHIYTEYTDPPLCPLARREMLLTIPLAQ